MPHTSKHWYMLTLVGQDAPGIVAGVTRALAEHACNLGETSMIRLGGNFTIMMLAETQLTKHQLTELMQPVAKQLGLRLHIDIVENPDHHRIEPDVLINALRKIGIWALWRRLLNTKAASNDSGPNYSRRTANKPLHHVL